MTRSEESRYCDVCKQHIRDYSKTSIQELSADSTQDSQCGSYYSWQLNKPFGNWKDVLIVRYQRLLLDTGNGRVKRYMLISLLMIVMVLSGCYKRYTGYRKAVNP